MESKTTTLAFSALLSLLITNIMPFIAALAVVMTCDYVTGIVKAVIKGTYKGRLAVRGIFKKLCYLLVLVGGMGVDIAVYYYTAQDTPIFYISTTMAVWLIMNDFISILLNLEKIGIKMPKFLKEYLAKIQKEGEQK